MNITIIWTVLVSFSSFVFSSSTISFEKEQENIMLQYKLALYRSFGPSNFHYFKLPAESILAIDPIIFLREMQKVNDPRFLITF
jgi:hypothetical protein